MTLDQYLASESITAAAFGERAGLSEASVSRIRRFDQNITRDVMLKIIGASGGRITADGLVSGSSSRPPPAKLTDEAEAA